MRLIDADALGVTDFEIVLCGGDYKELCKTLIAKVESAPTIDAVPVVRCKDCVHFYDSWGEEYCHKGHLPTPVGAEWFCPLGERKNDE